MAERQEPLGLYGIAIRGLGGAAGDRPAPPGSWDVWDVRQVVDLEVEGPEGMVITLQSARIGLSGVGVLIVDRPARTITFVVREPISDQALLHPGLVPAAAVISWWEDRVAMHASAVVVGDGVWGLLADREGGKSTTAALLAESGASLFTDDMLIVDDDGVGFAGPGSVDLRAAASEALGGEPLGVLGERERFRKLLGVGQTAAPMSGFVVLDWSADGSTAVTPLAASDRVALVARHASMPIKPKRLLDMADMPMYRFARPHDMVVAASAAQSLLDFLRHA